MNSTTIPVFNPDLPIHMTFEEHDWHLLAQYWYPVALARDISEQPLGTMLLDMPLVIYKMQDELIVAKDACPHRGVPLSLGKNDGQGVVCPYHGLRFGTQGKCNRIPAHPQHKISDRFHLRTYAAVERYGLIWCSLTADKDAEPNIPVMPYWNDADYQQLVCPQVDIKCFAGRQLEGFIDVAHFAWVHPDTFGDPNDVEVPDYTTTETEYGFSADYISSVGRYPIGLDQRGQEDFKWLRHFEISLPFTATLTIHFPNDAKQVIMNAASPMTARQTRLFAPICRNYDKDLPVEEAYDFNLKIFEEDRLIVENQKPEFLPLDLSLEAHFPADRSSSMYRKLLRKKGFNPLFAA
ncbi:MULTISPECIES: aromatic ring-hydroxylating oxygenase subunit alpha [unclassified Acinetobacter]|uniref:aromatic ring-hydroxylating oxygenase subunit alpha n=1 Tax=unclassified Acinetobacter TaxID=196816 RepID=UPI0015D14075|nr:MULTISPECIES: aromatic ring-hydroxylating dioxygenase subunit alpha [unclassified Acinetobacter]